MSIESDDIWNVKMARSRKGNHHPDTQCNETERTIKGIHEREQIINGEEVIVKL